MNGGAKGWVKASIGLTRRPSLSFLFTIVAHVLSRMVVRVEDKGFLEAFLVGKDKTRVLVL